MKSNIENSRKEQIRNAELPTYTNTRKNGKESYTVIPHSFVMDTAEDAFKAIGLSVRDEKYANTFGASVVTGTYYLNKEDDNYQMTYSFTNSYNKQVRFRTAIGVRHKLSDAVIIRDLDDWYRKHTGDADIQARNAIVTQINNCSAIYNEIIEDLALFKTINLSKIEYAHLLGELFVGKIISSSQLNIIHKEYKKPSFNYGTDNSCLYTIYMHICYALKEDHPKSYLQDLSKAHSTVLLYAHRKKDEVNKLELELNFDENTTDNNETEDENINNEPTQEQLNNYSNKEEQELDSVPEPQEYEEVPEPQEYEEVSEPQEDEEIQSEQTNATEECDLDAIRKEFQSTIDEEKNNEIVDLEEIPETIADNEIPEELKVQDNIEDNSKEICESDDNTIEETNAVPKLDTTIIEQNLSYFDKDSYPFNIGDYFEDEGKTYLVVESDNGILTCKETIRNNDINNN